MYHFLPLSKHYIYDDDDFKKFEGCNTYNLMKTVEYPGHVKMWHVGIFLAPSHIILKSTYIPGRGRGRESRRKFFLELLVVTVIITISIVIVCAQVYPVYAPETLPPHHS